MAESEVVMENGSAKAEKRAASEEAVKESPPTKVVKLSEPTDLEKKIIRQIEYYFGDINLGRDKFMQTQIAENNGWITFVTLLTFKRLAALTTDKDVIIAALAKSENQLLVVSEDGLKVRRHPDLPVPENNPERRRELMLRTAYVKGFPLDKSFDELLQFFDSKSNVENFIRRTYLDKATKQHVFKGSVFVTFKTVEDCKKFIEGGPYKYNDEGPDLIIKEQEGYLEEKKKQRDENKNEKNKLKKEANDYLEKKIPDCSVVHLTGFPDKTTWEDIKSKLTELGAEVAYVEYSKGEPEAFVRLQGEDSGEKLVKECKDSKLEITGATVTIRALEGEELEAHKETIRANMAQKKKHHSKQNKKNFGGRKRRGRN